MGEFDVKFAAYERAMQQHNYWGLQGDAIGEQLGRQSVALQQAEIKKANKRAGHEFARQLAEERQALQNGLNGGKITTEIIGDTTVISTNTNEAKQTTVKIADKIACGNRGNQRAYFLIDTNGNVYKVDRKVYNRVSKRGTVSSQDLTQVNTSKSGLPKKVQNSAEKIKLKLKQTSELKPTNQGNRIKQEIHEILSKPTLEQQPTINNVLEKIDELGNKIDKQKVNSTKITHTLNNLETNITHNMHTLTNKVDSLSNSIIHNNQRISQLTNVIENQRIQLDKISKFKNRQLLILTAGAALLGGLLGSFIGRNKNNPVQNQPQIPPTQNVKPIVVTDTITKQLTNDSVPKQVKNDSLSQQVKDDSVPQQVKNDNLSQQNISKVTNNQANGVKKAINNNTIAQKVDTVFVNDTTSIQDSIVTKPFIVPQDSISITDSLSYDKTEQSEGVPKDSLEENSNLSENEKKMVLIKKLGKRAQKRLEKKFEKHPEKFMKLPQEDKDKIIYLECLNIQQEEMHSKNAVA